jgi:UDP-glucose 4-epimerase
MEVASGKRRKMEVFGNDYDTKDGTGVRDYIHVSDLASAHVKALEYLASNDSLTVNLATGESHSVLDVINLAKEVSGKEIPYEIVSRRPGDPAELYAGTNMAFEKLNWKAEYSDLRTLLETTWKVYSR